MINIFNLTETNFPDADVHVSTLDAYFSKLLIAAPQLNLSVITGEIGDSWIYGVYSMLSPQLSYCMSTPPCP